MQRVKKILNDTADVVAETVEGLVLASDGTTRLMDGHRVIVRQPSAKENGRKGKVGLLVGGGSGHEPLFSGWSDRASPMRRYAATCSRRRARMPSRRPPRTSMTAPACSTSMATMPATS